LKSLFYYLKDEIGNNEKYLSHLREHYSIEDLMIEPDTFKLDINTSDYLEMLEGSNIDNVDYYTSFLIGIYF